MKCFATVVAALLGLSAQAVAQSFSPVVVVNAACGSGSKEFDFDINTAPSNGLAVGDNDDIFVIDEFNNRVQHFDAKGGYLGGIAFPPSIPPTPAEMARNPNMSERPTFVEQIEFIDGALYALQQRCVNGGVDYACRVGQLLRAQGNTFINADKQDDARRILLRFTLQYVDADLRAAYAKLGMKPEDFTKKFSPGQGCGKSRNCFVAQILFDDKNNIWVLSSAGLRVFSAAGGLLYDNATRSNADVFSKNGNLYRLSYWGPAYGNSCVQVEKYSLFGK